QQTSVAEVEGVVHRTRGMVRGKVECLEVVPVVLDLGTFGHRIAELREDRLDALAGTGQWMDRAATPVASGLGGVEAFRSESLLQRRALEGLLAGRDRIADFFFRGIDFRTACLA